MVRAEQCQQNLNCNKFYFDLHKLEVEQPAQTGKWGTEPPSEMKRTTSTTSRARSSLKVGHNRASVCGPWPRYLFPSPGRCTAASSPISVHTHTHELSGALVRQRHCVSCVSSLMLLRSVNAHFSGNIWEGCVYCDCRPDGGAVYWVSEGKWRLWLDYQRLDLKGFPRAKPKTNCGGPK